MPRFVLFLFAIFLAGCTSEVDPWAKTPPGQLKVLASFPPIYCFAANVAKDDARVLCLLTGTGPHDYEAVPTDARKVAGADVFVLNGVELEKEFASNLVQIARAEPSKMFELGGAFDKKSLIHVAAEKRDHGDHQHGEFDPHVWLGLPEAQTMVRSLGKKLGELDPAQKDAFAKNAEEYANKIKALEDYGREKFKGKKSTSFIAQHEALGYFARTFGLNLVDSIQPRPGMEADSRKLAGLIEACKKNDVRVIAVEPQYSRGQADTLARALKDRGLEVRVVEFDPMETASKSGASRLTPSLYLDRMKANIDTLAEALP